MTWATAKNLKDQDPKRLERTIAHTIVFGLFAAAFCTGLYLGGIQSIDDASQAWREAREAKAMLERQQAKAIPELVALGRKQREKQP